MSQYIKTFNTRDEYNAWASGYTEGYAVSAYIVSENAIAGKEYTPFLQASADATAFEYPATYTTLHIKSNLNWTITKPAWVTMESAGTCSADITMTIAANDESKSSRSGNVVISYNQTSSETITLTQQGNPSYTGVPTNEIWYTTSDGNILLVTAYASWPTVASNTYSEGKGIITFESPITSIPDYGFQNCNKLRSVILPNSIISLGKLCFNGSGITGLTFGTGNITSLPKEAFSQCPSLIALDIPETVTTIGENAFLGCSSLTGITIPSGVTSIIGNTFLSCYALTSLICLPIQPPTTTSLFLYNSNNCQIYVPSGSVDAYKSTRYWSNYADRIQAIPE